MKVTAQNYVELVESFESLSGEIRTLDADDANAAVEELRTSAARLCRAVAAESLERLAIWHVDYFYRLLNRLDSLDPVSFAVLDAIGRPVSGHLAYAGRALAYLVDNAIPHDRLIPAGRFFGALGYVVASPELLAGELAKHDGVVWDDVCGPHLPQYLGEGSLLAKRLYLDLVSQTRCVAWLSGNTSAEWYQGLGKSLEGSGYIGVFRNLAPVEGSQVQVFQSAEATVPVDPAYGT
jgi:hypothetical protein